jgi:hypothetical protein
MVKKCYIDAAIWRGLHENRSDRFRPLGDWAFELVKKIIKIHCQKKTPSNQHLFEMKHF